MDISGCEFVLQNCDPSGELLSTAVDRINAYREQQKEQSARAERERQEEEAARRRKEEERAEKKRKEEEKKEEARKVAEEKKRIAEQEKIDENVASVQKDEYALRLEESKRRMEELTKQIQAEQRPPQLPANWAEQQLQAYARGEGDLPKRPATAVAPSPGPAVTPAAPSASNAFVLKPELQEQRTVGVATPGSAPNYAICSTFSGTNLEGRGCPPSAGVEARADAERKQAESDEEFRRAEEQRKANESAAAYDARVKAKAEADRKEAVERASQYTEVVDVKKEGCGLNPSGRSKCLALGKPGVWCTVCTVQRRCTKGSLGKLNASCGPPLENCDTSCHDL